MVEQATDEDITRARRVFRMFDKDGNGTITLKELGICVRGMGQNPTTSELKEMVLALDQNSNGLIEFEEFLVMFMEHKKNQDDVRRDIENAFKIFDKNGTGYISFKELKGAMKLLGESLTDDELRDMFKEADQNGDKKISITEFTKVLTS